VTLAGRTWGVPVRAEFTCPDSRTIVVHITEGEGMGSVVETHATPLGLRPDGRRRTMVTEATIAYSDRPGFPVARWLSRLLRPGIRHTARKLWVDDLAYAERRYKLRQRGEFPADRVRNVAKTPRRRPRLRILIAEAPSQGRQGCSLASMQRVACPRLRLSSRFSIAAE
jgi:hypothetical protein